MTAQTENDQACRVLILCCSIGGNTRKVARTIHAEIQNTGLSADFVEFNADLDVDIFDYNLVFLGAPVYNNLAPLPLMKYLLAQKHRAACLSSAPEKPGQYAVVFCTYGGGHTGINEAIPLLKYMGQIFEHEGVRVVDEWPVVGEFPTAKTTGYNEAGRLGDVTARPNAHDLQMVAGQTAGLLQRLKYKLNIADLLGPAAP